MIHPTTIIGDNVSIGKNVTIGPYNVIDNDVSIGDGTTIGNSNTIKKYTKIGENCQIYHHCVIGELPQDLKFGSEKTTVEIGDDTVVREFVSIHRGTNARGKSTIGTKCFLMAYSHVAHDCKVGNNVTLINLATLGGHVEIDDWAMISGSVMVHQFVKIGAYVIIGGNYRVSQDVPPYVTAVGDPLRYAGINTIGLKRRGFTSIERMEIKRAYRIYFHSGLKKKEALDRLNTEFSKNKNVQLIVEFIENSERGII
jgi:UDP-N-acetylglucosamine acyltransferase